MVWAIIVAIASAYYHAVPSPSVSRTTGEQIWPERDGWRSSGPGRDLAPGLSVGIAAAIVDSRRLWARGGHRAFPAASTIKVAILVALAQALDAGWLTLSDRRVVEADLIVQGSGVLLGLEPRLSLPLSDLAI